MAKILTINYYDALKVLKFNNHIVGKINNYNISSFNNNLVMSGLSSGSLVPPNISWYDDYSAIKMDSVNDKEDEYEIYVNDSLVGTCGKLYSFEADGANLTKCIGRQYYTGEIITPTSVNGTAITSATASNLFADCVASKITFSEGITTVSESVFTLTTETTNISFPSTISNLSCLKGLSLSTINIGLENYIEYAWDISLPTQSSALISNITGTKTINFYIKSTITTLGDKCLYVSMGTNNLTLTMNLYFNESSSETMTIGTGIVYTGNSKYTTVYNVYTDNASIKDAMLTYAGQYCTVNVYKRNGGSW